MYINANKGVYRCNNKLYFSKLEAILEANRSNQHVHWDFYDDIFGAHDWTKPSHLSINELYKQRAEQLRDNYDYLVLFYSGGVDSGYILKTFIENNIKLDEIYIFGAYEAEKKKFKKLGLDTTPGYYTREIEYIAKPIIQQILKSRKIKVNVYDWEKDMLDATKDLDWFWQTGSRFGPDALVRNNFHKRFHEHNDMIHKGKKVGFIYGVDKPRFCRDDHNIYLFFLDVVLTTGTTNKNDILGETWENDEYFYWNPNALDILTKQAHLVTNYLKQTNNIQLIDHIDNIASWHISDFNLVVNPIIYPNWNHNIWQIKKTTNLVYHEVSQWFLDSNTPEFTRWESSLWELERQIGKKWFNKNTVINGLEGRLSPLYNICNI